MKKRKGLMSNETEREVKFNIDPNNYSLLKLRNRNFPKEEYKLLVYMITWCQYYGKENHGWFHHSFEDIADDMELSEKHIRNTSTKLIERNFIEKTAKPVAGSNNKNIMCHFRLCPDNILPVITEVFEKNHKVFNKAVEALYWIKELNESKSYENIITDHIASIKKEMVTPSIQLEKELMSSVEIDIPETIPVEQDLIFMDSITIVADSYPIQPNDQQQTEEKQPEKIEPSIEKEYKINRSENVSNLSAILKLTKEKFIDKVIVINGPERWHQLFSAEETEILNKLFDEDLKDRNRYDRTQEFLSNLYDKLNSETAPVMETEEVNQ